jgi:hypothetical protein
MGVTVANLGPNCLARPSAKAGGYVLTVLPPVDSTVTAEALGVRKLEQSRVSLRFNQKPRAEITRFRVEAFNLFNHLRFV